MNVEKLIGTMAEIIGEKHGLIVKPKIRNRGGFFENEGVGYYERKTSD